MAMPPPAVCDRARQTRDARFDGLFFTGVRSTLIFCRPVCPAPTPKPQNIVYFPSSAAATSAGYRPCLRCRPELSPDNRPNDQTVCRALALIAEGWLEEGSVEALASRVGASPRHLRRLFLDKAGATPLAVHQARRTLLAKQLLTDTMMPVTQVALAAGFASVRRFNDAFKAHCGMVPTAVRRRALPTQEECFGLRLAYRPPFDFTHSLAVLQELALPGIERVSADAYERNVSVGLGQQPAYIRITHRRDKPELLLQTFGVQPESVQPIVRRVRRMFDLDADMQAAHAMLAADATLARSIAAHPGWRLVGGWDGFEVAVAAILKLDGKDDGSLPLMQRLVKELGKSVVGASPGLHRVFPSTKDLATSDLETRIGAPPAIALAVRRLAAAVRDGQLNFSRGLGLDEFVSCFTECTGMPIRLAHQVAGRALGDPDAWASDAFMAGGCLQTIADLRSSAWRPWRAYASLHLESLRTDQVEA